MSGAPTQRNSGKGDKGRPHERAHATHFQMVRSFLTDVSPLRNHDGAGLKYMGLSVAWSTWSIVL